MTVSTQANKAQFNGAGTTGPFTFNFRFFNNSEIFAIKTSTTGVDTNLSETVDYTLTGSGSYSGGSLSLISSLAVGERLTVYRVLPLTQATDLRNQGAFFAEVHEDAFDKLTMIVQQHEEELDRAVQIPITSDITPTEYLAAIETIKDEAETAQAGAEAAQAATEAVLDEFTDIYLGVKANDPTTDNDGNALQEGALYWNSTVHRMRVYETGAWTDVPVSSSFTVDTFSGTGAQTEFTLSANPGIKNNTIVTISGVYQQKATYSVSGTTLTFTTAPPSGTSNIEVCIASTVSLNVPADDSVTTAALQDDAVTNAKLAFDGGALSGFRNVIINGNFSVNQRAYASGAAVGAGLYGHDRWKMAASGDTYTYSTTANVTTVTIPSGKVLQQVIEGINLQSGTYVLSWTGTAQGKIGAGSYGASGITGTATGGTNLTIEFGPGTVSKVQFEFGSTPTPFEARPVGVELALCQRYAEKSYELSVAKGTSTTVGAIHFIGSTTGAYQQVTYKTRKRNTAGQVMYIYGSTGVQNTMRNISSSSDLTATAGNISETGFTMQNTSAAANAVYAFHYFVEDEL